jgi:hypothetical protein
MMSETFKYCAPIAGALGFSVEDTAEAITYKVNGRHTLKGVGKNPLLATAKSKTDKNVSGLLSQVESGKFTICSYENSYEIEAGGTAVSIVDMMVASVESTTILFLGNVFCTVTADDDPEHPVVSFLYKVDDVWIEDFKPMQVVLAGANMLPLFFPLGGLSANSAKHIEVFMMVEGGSALIGVACCKASAIGSSIAGGVVEWDGRIVVEDSVELLGIQEVGISLKTFEDVLAVRTQVEDVHGFSDSVFLMELGEGDPLTLFGISDSMVFDVEEETDDD